MENILMEKLIWTGSVEMKHLGSQKS